MSKGEKIEINMLDSEVGYKAHLLYDAVKSLLVTKEYIDHLLSKEDVEPEKREKTEKWKENVDAIYDEVSKALDSLPVGDNKLCLSDLDRLCKKNKIYRYYRKF